MEQLEGRLTTRALAELVRSAAAANMNMLRVWGGGAFAPDAFYDECDEQGMLLLHDFMYAQHGHTPSATPEQAAEVAHQVYAIVSTANSHNSLLTAKMCVTPGAPPLLAPVSRDLGRMQRVQGADALGHRTVRNVCDGHCGEGGSEPTCVAKQPLAGLACGRAPQRWHTRRHAASSTRLHGARPLARAQGGNTH